jgi:acetyl esterase/lipase
MANEPVDVRFVQHSMYYPVTGAAMDTGSYEQFAEGYFLTAKTMAWFWDAYAPDVDVLRDEGEAYAARLRAAGVAVTTVRYNGITHDFMMLNRLNSTHATRAAVAQAI